jgi:hypothetical protein
MLVGSVECTSPQYVRAGSNKGLLKVDESRLSVGSMSTFLTMESTRLEDARFEPVAFSLQILDAKRPFSLLHRRSYV